MTRSGRVGWSQRLEAKNGKGSRSGRRAPEDRIVVIGTGLGPYEITSKPGENGTGEVRGSAEWGPRNQALW